MKYTPGSVLRIKFDVFGRHVAPTTLTLPGVAATHGLDDVSVDVTRTSRRAADGKALEVTVDLEALETVTYCLEHLPEVMRAIEVALDEAEEGQRLSDEDSLWSTVKIAGVSAGIDSALPANFDPMKSKAFMVVLSGFSDGDDRWIDFIDTSVVSISTDAA